MKNHVKWHIKTHLQNIPRNFTKNSRSYQMPTAPSLSFKIRKKLSWTILKTFAHFRLNHHSFILSEMLCLSVTLQLTTVRGVFLFAEKKPMLSAVRNNRESGVASRLKLKLADEATKQMKWNNQILMLPKQSKHSYTSESYVSALATIHLFSLNTKQPKSTRTKVNWMLLVHSIVIQ